ncbi:MAG: Do family serine endopeptidase [Treponema sp.]|jgi:Do/DeqQ family serine protease|nr:Do family serine endopeptidase [Treponema sp.]
MNIMQRLSSKNLLVFNLVLIGVIFGFSLAFLSFSCSTPQARHVARAQENPVILDENSLAIALGLQNAFNAVSDKVLPSVVELKTVSVRRRTIPNFDGIPWEFFFGPRDRNPDNRGGQEREFRSQGLGSGLIVRHNNGTYYALTNNHVVDGTTEIRVATKDGKEYPAELVGKDERRDLAMVSFKTSDTYPLAVLGDSDAVRVGDWAIAMGNPLGEQFSFSVTMGIVSAVGRTGGPGGNINDFIQTDAPINQGNSGGPLVNIRGEIIGINTWIASNASGGGNVGLGFAIPINNAKRSIDEFISSGTISYGWLGVQLTEPGRETVAALGIEGKRGALASQVFLDSPADKGGIRPGDFITHVGGREARGVNQLTMMVGDLKAGDSATFTVIRDGASRDIQVRIEARTPEVTSDNRKLWPGVHLVFLTDEMRSSLNLGSDARGLYVAQVLADSPSDIIGMRQGDLINSVNDEEVRDLRSFYRVLRERATKELYFGFTRNGASLESLKFRR